MSPSTLNDAATRMVSAARAGGDAIMSGVAKIMYNKAAYDKTACKMRRLLTFNSMSSLPRLSGAQMLARDELPEKTAPRTDQDRDQISDPAGEDDRRAGRHIGVIGEQQADRARPEGADDRGDDEIGHLFGPEAGRHRRQQHDADR